MTKHEFLNRFSNELNRRGVADAEDIVENTRSTSPSSRRTAIPRKRSPPSWAIRRSWPHSLNNLPPSKASVAKKPPS